MVVYLASSVVWQVHPWLLTKFPRSLLKLPMILDLIHGILYEYHDLNGTILFRFDPICWFFPYSLGTFPPIPPRIRCSTEVRIYLINLQSTSTLDDLFWWQKLRAVGRTAFTEFQTVKFALRSVALILITLFTSEAFSSNQASRPGTVYVLLIQEAANFADLKTTTS